MLLNDQSTSMQIGGYKKTIYQGAGTGIFFLSGLIHRSFEAEDGTYKIALFCEYNRNLTSAGQSSLVPSFYGTLNSELILNMTNIEFLEQEFKQRIKMGRFTEKEFLCMKTNLFEPGYSGKKSFTKISNTKMEMMELSSYPKTDIKVLEDRFLDVFSSMRDNRKLIN